MKFICTLKIHIAQGIAECNMNFQSAYKFHIAQYQSVIFPLLYDYMLSLLLLVNFCSLRANYCSMRAITGVPLYTSTQ